MEDLKNELLRKGGTLSDWVAGGGSNVGGVQELARKDDGLRPESGG